MSYLRIIDFVIPPAVLKTVPDFVLSVAKITGVWFSEKTNLQSIEFSIKKPDSNSKDAMATKTNSLFMALITIYIIV